MEIVAQADGTGCIGFGAINWNDARGGIGAPAYNLGGTYIEASASYGYPAGYYRVWRGFICLDTSSLVAADLNKRLAIQLYIWNLTSPRNIEDDLGYAKVHLVEGHQHLGVDRHLYATEDFQNHISYLTSMGSKELKDLVIDTWIEIELNAVGKSWINLGGLTKFCLRTDADINNNIPTGINLWSWRLVPIAAKLVVSIVLPTVTTDPATAIVFPTTTLNGTLDNDGGETCACGFEWGETVAYGNTTPTQSRTVGQTFSQIVGGLSPATTYHFRAFATNSMGTVYGADRTFTTGIPFAINKAYALAREEL